MRRFPETIETVIWDFNGTLVDDVALVLRSVNAQLIKRDLPAMTVERYRDVFGFPVEAYYRRIGLDFDRESMAEVSAEFFDLYASGLARCPLQPGVTETLGRFSDQGVRQFVLSAMEETLLRSAVERSGISGFFDAVYGLAHLKADSKLSRGHDLLDDRRLRVDHCMLIGDTDHDAEVASALGLVSVLIARGHQNRRRLAETGRPIFDDLVAFWEELNPTSPSRDG